MWARLKRLLIPSRLMAPSSPSWPDLKLLRAAYEDLRSARQTCDEGEAEHATRTWRTACRDFAAQALPYEEYIRELAMLGLRGRPHAGEDYRAALEAYLGLRIAIVRPPNVAFGANSRVLGRTSYGPGLREVTVEIPRRLSWWLYQYTLLHELGHVAAGHPPCSPNEHTGEIALGNPPPERLARKHPLTKGLAAEAFKDLYEAEAELRVEHAFLAGALGQGALATDKLTQVS